MSRRRHSCSWPLALLFGCLAVSCGGSPTQPTSNLFAIRACNDVFRVRIDDAAVARQAADLVGKGHVKIVCGLVRAGDGGFNTPWPWHLDPASINFADVTAEIYDGCPRGTENRVGSEVSYFCPWSTEVLRKE